jgi:hypothetical protein
MIPFFDRDSKDDGFFYVRFCGDVVGLAVSLSKDGDIEVFVGGKEIDALIEALGKARALLDKPA